MRKAQKAQAEQLADLLGRVHDGIRMSIETGEKEAAMNFLGQCQDAAISLGETIEETEGEGFATVTLLEDYCERVYQLYETLRQNQSVSANKAYKSLKKSLAQIKNSIKNDIKVRTEAVFLPYKASMWDSLESVWKAADEDPDCDAYVIPIPYFDRNPDGSFKEEHYEGDQYPDYVPVTWYGDYNFEEHRPDLVFIHNPYDECNYVTSVHPFFYSKNLKQYTDKLVYILYFILGEIDPENKEAVKGIEHFITVPGVIYADQVVVQSEDMRKAYVDVMTRYAKESGMDSMDKKYWEEKVLGLGSPKVDKVLGTKKEDLEIPEEWLKVIEKPDGSWKKIIFYNTTVSALLQHGEKYLAKMKDVFQVFYENREDVALLWRPHPLMEATIKSMRSELWEEYERIVGAYREAEWGIYDDTAELDRAIGVCDGYYGDASSVVELCKRKYKPSMLQNVKLSIDTKNKNCMVISLVDAVKINNEIWFYPYYFDRLFVMNIEKKKLKYYDIPNSVKIDTKIGNFRSMVHIGQKIYLIPFYAQSILQFEIKTKKITIIEIDKKWINEKNELFMGTGLYHDFLFIMGVNIPVIIRLDTRNNSIEYIVDWAEKIKNLIFNNEDAFFRKQSVLLDNRMFVPFCNTNAILEINCENLETTIHPLGYTKDGYSGICFSNDSMWLSPRYCQNVTKWDIKTNTIQKIKTPRHENDNNFYVGIVSQKNKKILLHGTKGISTELEKNVYELKGGFDFLQEDKDVLMYYETMTGILTIYDKIKDTFKNLKIEMKKDYINISSQIFVYDKYVFEENREVNLIQLIKSIQKTENGNIVKNDDYKNSLYDQLYKRIYFSIQNI